MTSMNDTLSVTDTAGGVSKGERRQSHLFVVLDRGRLTAGGSRHSLANIEEVTIGRGKARTAQRIVEGGVATLHLRLPDRRMSSLHARLLRDSGGWVLQDCQSTNGVRTNGRRIERAVLADGDFIELGQTLLRFRLAMATPCHTPGDLDSVQLQGLLGAFGTISPERTAHVEDLARVARSELSVLLQGETGTGKEVLARAIHAASGRRGPFVAVNCGTLPHGLVESLLFGHNKGAFTGAARDECGFVRAADGGTLFLDEVGDLPPSSQVALLRVLQEREVVPLGATRPHPVDVRFLAATHRSLAAMAEAGAFRSDLLARLAQYTHDVPPLRERIEDIGVLVAAIVSRVAGDGAGALSLSAEAARHLVESRWPANVRELEHFVRVSITLAPDGRLAFVGSPRAGEPPAPKPTVSQRSLDDLSAEDAALYRSLVDHMRTNRGNLTQVAQAMGKARRQIQRWTARFQIDPSQFRR